ncbi:hypothetical protein ACLK1Y_09380 [Escherichia coli]
MIGLGAALDYVNALGLTAIDEYGAHAMRYALERRWPPCRTCTIRPRRAPWGNCL